ncbi:hypothetical protein GGH95_003980 [Coemansia sp. RSA 1836]|nr:hypothetical protein GGH95_003980 [Coemansia sp. RSA 1836]
MWSFDSSSSSLSDKSEDSKVKYQYLAHTSCDVIEERMAKADMYMGLLQTVGELAVYGYVLNTGMRIILIISVPPDSVVIRSAAIREVFQQIHAGYIALVCNPFNESDNGGGGTLVSEKFDLIVGELGRIHSN